MMYSFEGKYDRRPDQDLSGASQKESREVLLKRAQQERQKREEQRRRQHNAVVIQSKVRSFMARQRKKKEVRASFDCDEAKCDSIEALGKLIGRFLFFYSPAEDDHRHLELCRKMLCDPGEIFLRVESDRSWRWLVKRFLAICVRAMSEPDETKVMFHMVQIFTSRQSEQTKMDVWPYLIQKGYFRELRAILDAHPNHLDQCLILIYSPINVVNSLKSSTDKDVILSRFCSHFLCPDLSPQIKDHLIPFVLKKRNFPYDDLLKYIGEKNNFNSAKNLLYCVIMLEPPDFEPNEKSLEVLAALTKSLHHSVIDLTDDSDEEMPLIEQTISIHDFVNIMNKTERVKKILQFFDRNMTNAKLLNSLADLCHHLLLVFKDSIHKFMIVYMLGLKDTFLKKLWERLKSDQKSVNDLQYSSFVSWNQKHTYVSVFCSLFCLYSTTLTDSDTANLSSIFSLEELGLISEVLKSMALSMIDLAFPMCRSNAVPATPELLHLYNSCLSAVQVLYTLDLRKHFCKGDFWTVKKIHISHDLSRRNYLSKTLQPFVGIVHEEEDEYLPPLSTIEQRSLAVLQHLPFLVEFNTRVLLLRDLCRHSISPGGMFASNRTEFPNEVSVIRRSHLYEDAFEKLSLENEPDLRQVIRIQFVNNAGLNEPGIDGGGIFKEFLQEVLRTAFDPNRGFFLLTNDNSLYPNPNVHLLVEDYIRHYVFIGRLLGKALFENILVDLPLADFFAAKILVNRIETYHLKSLDPILYRNILYLKDYSGDVQDLGLDFTIASNDLGETRVVELKTNGSNVPVTNYNRLEYIHLLADYKLNLQMKKQCSAFRDGLDSVIPLLWLRIFSHHELQVLIGGDTQEINLEDLKNHTAYGGEFSVDHPTIIMFWTVVESFTEEQKKQLLKFVTSCPRPPLLGFKELSPSFCIQSAGSENRMPTASTCLNLLKLPVIKSESVLREKLLAAIEQQAGFELS